MNIDFWAILYEIYKMFLEMSPYIMLGLAFVALLNIFVNKEQISRHIGKNNFISVLKAAMFVVPLPLCSCGVVPTTVYLHKNGASKASTLSFLISTPQTGIDSIIATYGLLGPVFAVFRPFAAFIMGITGGMIANLIENKKIKETPKPAFDPTKISFNIIESGSSPKAPVCDDGCGDITDTIHKLPIQKRIIPSLKYAFVDFVDDISMQFIVGVIISGLIAYFIPANYFAELGIGTGILGMLILIAIGIPMYVCATASIPIALTLIAKGFSPGVAFVFLATGPATNAASLAIIGKTLGKEITSIYLITIILTSIFMGYLLDFILNSAGIMQSYVESLPCHSESIEYEVVKVFFSVVFAGLILYTMSIKFQKKYFNKNTKNNKLIKVNISGMTCNHCVNNVQKAMAELDGINEFEVSLAENCVYYSGNIELSVIKNKIDSIGYKVID